MIPLGPTWTAQLWFEEFVMRQDPEFYNNLCDGEAAYTDDTSIEALSIMKEFGEKGYWGEVNKANSLSLDDMPRSMEQGDYAMTLTPSWLAGLWESQDLDFSKYEWFHLPVINSEVEKQMIWEPAPIFCHSGYSDKEALDAAADVLLSEEYQQKWSGVQGFIPANQNVDPSYLTDEMSGLWESVQNDEFTIQLRMLENTSWQVIGPGAKVLKRAFKPDADIQDIAQKLDDLRTEVYG
jgi:ABC-type glycerol-3-phosphate transport system substrate-binding protein